MSAYRDGLARICDERARQVVTEGYDPEHDDHHSEGQLALAAACYASPDRVYTRHEYATETHYRDPWPFDDCYDKRPRNGNMLREATDAQKIRLLEKAGALCAAEIDRLLRREAAREKIEDES